MTESMIERVAQKLAAQWLLSQPKGVQPDMPYWCDMARAAIEAMREPTDFQRNKYYELSHNTETMFDAHWERAIDAALIWPAGSADKAGVPLAKD